MKKDFHNLIYSIDNENLLSNFYDLLKKRISGKEGMSITGVVFHSDGGGQYYAKEFLKLTRKEGIVNGMCEHPWENRKTERLNGVTKNNYLIHRDINSFEELKKEVDQTVLLYNREKPHIELRRKKSK